MKLTEGQIKMMQEDMYAELICDSGAVHVNPNGKVWIFSR